MRNVLKGLFFFEIEASTGPLIDIYETSKDLVFEVDLPGVDISDISIKVYEDLLIIEREKNINNLGVPDDSKYLCMERCNKGFRRVLKIPIAVNTTSGEAFYNNGVLTIIFPKLKGRLININIKKSVSP